MKSIPAVMEKLYLENNDFIADLVFDTNITILTGQAATGKTVVFHMIKDGMKHNDTIVCFNYENGDSDILQSIKAINGKLVVIDNADILLDDEIRKYISLDLDNQYLLIGRNPKNLFTTSDNLHEIQREKVKNKTRLFNVLYFA